MRERNPLSRGPADPFAASLVGCWIHQFGRSSVSGDQPMGLLFRGIGWRLVQQRRGRHQGATWLSGRLEWPLLLHMLLNLFGA